MTGLIQELEALKKYIEELGGLTPNTREDTGFNILKFHLLEKVQLILSRYKAKSAVGNQDGSLREALERVATNGVEFKIADWNSWALEINKALRDHPIPQEAQEGLRRDLLDARYNVQSAINDKTPEYCVKRLKDATAYIDRALFRHPQSSPVKDNPYPDTVLISSEEKARLMVNDHLRNEIWEYKEELKANGGNSDTVDDLEKILEKTGKGVPVKEDLAMVAELMRIIRQSRIIRICQPSIVEMESVLKRYGYSDPYLPYTKDEKEKK